MQAMFEELVNDAASRVGVTDESASAVMTGLLALMVSERSGGLDGLLDRFRQVGLADTVDSWFGGHQCRTITPHNVEAALGSGTLETLATSSGLSRMSAASLLALVLPQLIGRLTPGGTLPSPSTLGSQIRTWRQPIVISDAPVVRIERPGRTRWVAWTAVAVAALTAAWWIRGPAGTIDPQVTLTNRDGRVTYAGLVRDASTEAALVNALRRSFGDANISGGLGIDRDVRPASWLPKIGELVATLGPGVDLSVNGDTIKFGGWLSPPDREALLENLRGRFGAEMTIVALGDAAIDATRAANDQAVSALVALGTSGVAPESLVRAMNLSVINFASGSADIPADSLDVIRRAAEALKAAPAGSLIEVGGHTDNTGDPGRNFALSQARAEAVRAALVSNGAPVTLLTTKGYGDSRPRSTNDTEYGRFQNRRIEYAIAR